MNRLSRFFVLIAVLLLAACGGGGGGSPYGGTPPSSGGGGGGGGGTTPTPTAADLVFVLSASSVANTGVESVVATATAIDGNRNVVAGVPVTISVNNNGVAAPSGTVTGTNGQISATIGIGSDRSNRTIRVTATSGGITKTADLQVQDTGGGSSGTASDLLVTLSSPTISSTGTTPVTATVTALDAKRNVLPGIVVSISANQGATVAPSGTTTNASGVVTAQIGIGGDPTLRAISITATVPGLAPKVVTLNVVAAPTTNNPTAADLSLGLSSNSVSNGGSGTVVATITAVDGNRNALAGIPVTLAVDSNAVASVSSSATNAQGVVTATISIGADRSNRSITVTASSGSLTRSASFVVVGANLTASFSPTVAQGSTGNQVEYRLVDFNSSPMSGQAVTVTRSGQNPVVGMTDINGKFVYTYDAPSGATNIFLTASAAGDTKTQSISVVPSGSSAPNASMTPESASLTPSPSVVSVNSLNSTTNQVELRALFLGPNNQPIRNVRVVFKLAPTNSNDGTITLPSGASFFYSDSTGVARGTFTPGQRSSPTNGVTVLGCWDVADFDATAFLTSGTCAAGRLISTTLTIASEALSVNIRTNNLVKLGAANLTYIKEFVVMVVDAAGQAKADVLITPSIDLTAYYKGVYAWGGVAWKLQPTLASSENYSWDGTQWVQGPATAQPQCPNEDANRNGVREASAYGGAVPAVSARQEDLNWNGDIDPRKADVAIKMVGSPRTNADGLAVLQIEYGQNLATWVDYVITVTASGISGTEARARYVGLRYGVGNLPFPADAVTSETVEPPFRISPYGKGFTGTVIPNPPTGVCTDTN
jgi:hypothetical protein